MPRHDPSHVPIDHVTGSETISLEPDAPGLISARRDGEPAVTSEDPVLAVLMHEHSVLSQRDNVLIGAILTLASIGSVIVGGLLLQLPDLCHRAEAAGRTPSPNCLTADEQWFYVLAPLPLAALAAILAMLALSSALNAQVLHKVERALQEKVCFDLPPDPSRREVHAIALPSGNVLSSLIFSARRHGRLRLYRYGATAMLVLVVAVLLSTLVVLMGRVDVVWRFITGAVYAPLVLLLLALIVRGYSPDRRLLRDTTAALHDLEQGATSPSHHATGWLRRDPQTERRPLGYLLLPRITELWMKSAAVWVPLVLVRLSSSTVWPGWWDAVAAVLVLEFLVYQARYMFNDAMDVDIDRGNARAGQKGRAPDMGRHTQTIIRAAALLRIVMGGMVITALLSPSSRITVAVLSVAILALMPIYDRFSEETRSYYRPVEKPDGQPTEQRRNAGLTKEEWLARVPAWPARIRSILVAPGYGFRGVAGASIAFGALLPWPGLVAVGLALAAIEAANVTMGWVLEGAAEIARDGTQYRPALFRAPHMAWLVRQAGLVPDPAIARPVPPQSIQTVCSDGKDAEGRPIDPTRPIDMADDPVLLTSWDVNGPRLWNAWTAVSLVSGAAAGLLLAHRFSDAAWPHLPATMALAAIPSALMVLPATPRLALHPKTSPWTWAIVPAALGCSGIVLWRAGATGAPESWVGATIPVLLGSLYLATRVSTYHAYVSMIRDAVDLCGRGAGEMVRLVHTIGAGFMWVFFGRDAYERLRPRRRRRKTEDADGAFPTGPT